MNRRCLKVNSCCSLLIDMKPLERKRCCIASLVGLGGHFVTAVVVGGLAATSRLHALRATCSGSLWRNTKIGCLYPKSSSFLDLPWRSRRHVQRGTTYVEVQPLFVAQQKQLRLGQLGLSNWFAFGASMPTWPPAP